MHIITISREFGSGGRELGKRLADLLECDYYDSEIITAVACESGLDPHYVEKKLGDHGWQNLPITFRGYFRFCRLYAILADTAAAGAEKGFGKYCRFGEGLCDRRP